jgi:SNF2 family DNA or RNA helicase
MLLESETWLNDMKFFFKNEGAIFTPFITLHGDKLKAFRKAGITGSETSIGESVLDIEKLRGFRVIFTNYETVVNYQFSFAMMKTAWSVVITDEAQEYKTPKTKISHALKSLSPSFRIACTGTPVETKLMDVWNIFDFLQPGSLLGSAKEFHEEFVKPFENQPERSKEILDSLRSKLNFGSKTAYVLRRDKTNELEGLPQKHVCLHYCDLSQEQREMHIDFVKRARTGGEDNHPFSIIRHLMHLYQHPALIPRYEPLSGNQTDEALAKCPKLVELVKILKDIRTKREKAPILFGIYIATTY